MPAPWPHPKARASDELGQEVDEPARSLTRVVEEELLQLVQEQAELRTELRAPGGELIRQVAWRLGRLVAERVRHRAARRLL